MKFGLPQINEDYKRYNAQENTKKVKVNLNLD